MFDFFSMFMTGKEVEIDGKKWTILNNVKGDFYLAVETGRILPLQVYLIHYKEKEREKE